MFNMEEDAKAAKEAGVPLVNIQLLPRLAEMFKGILFISV